MRLFLIACFAVFIQLQPPSPRLGIESNPPQNQTKAAQEKASNDKRGAEESLLVVKVLPTPKSDKEAADEQRQRQDQSAANWWMVRLTFLLFAAALIQVIVYGIQAKRLRETITKMDEIAKSQGEDMKAYITQAARSATAMEKVAVDIGVSARAAQDSVKIAGQALEANISKERARIKINVQPINPQSQTASGQINVNGVVCSLRNYGFSTGFILDFKARFFMGQMADIPADSTQCRQLWYAESLEARESSPDFLLMLEPSSMLTNDEILKIRQGEFVLHFYGFVNHRDVFKPVVWTTAIHLRWKMRWGGMIQGTVMDYWEPVGGPRENEEVENVYW
jgi:hypothetical protein